MSSFSQKIDEWMKEAETRPESAVTIVRLVSKRLVELSTRNEELLSENIALQNGTRVEEYQKRIAHLEYQLDLLKALRQMREEHEDFRQDEARAARRLESRRGGICCVGLVTKIGEAHSPPTA